MMLTLKNVKMWFEIFEIILWLSSTLYAYQMCSSPDADISSKANGGKEQQVQGQLAIKRDLGKEFETFSNTFTHYLFHQDEHARPVDFNAARPCDHEYNIEKGFELCPTVYHVHLT